MVVSQIADAAQACSGAITLGESFSGRVAVAVLDEGEYPRDWAVLEFGEGTCNRVDFATEVMTPLEQGCVDLELSGSVEVWTSLQDGTPASISTAMTANSLIIEGDLPFFIRHIDSMVALIVCLGQELEASSESL